jgi:serine/threonine-protein kinase
MAYQSNESGKFEVYVQAFPDGHSKRQISAAGGTTPAWPHNGRDLFFRTNGILMAAAYQVRGDSFVAEAPRIWFPKKIAIFPSTMSYNPAPDGKRLVALIPSDPPDEPHYRVIFLLNFFDELQRRVQSTGTQPQAGLSVLKLADDASQK